MNAEFCKAFFKYVVICNLNKWFFNLLLFYCIICYTLKLFLLETLIWPLWSCDCSIFSMFHYYADGPGFMQNSKERLGCIGENVSINCNAVGRPTPDVFLYKNGTLLKQSLCNLSHHFALNSESKFGSYTCVSNSKFGTVNVTTTIKMKGKVLN